jgi:hypothetical protein
MRIVKFSYLFQNGETGLICEKIWTLEEIEKGVPTIFLELNPQYLIIARREYTGIKSNKPLQKEVYEYDYITNSHLTCEIFWSDKRAAFQAHRQDGPDEIPLVKLLSDLPVEDKYWITGNIFEGKKR